MSPDAIAALLAPFLGGDSLSAAQLDQISTYLDLLLRWNARTNLTAVREPEHIVSRHIGESLFAARRLFSGQGPTTNDQRRFADLGSGAGFPGLPLKIWAPSIHITLIESQNKKATFLREVVRALKLEGVEVFAGRGEELAQSLATKKGPTQAAPITSRKSEIANGFDVVTLRAVERFESALDVAVRLLAPSARLALLIGAAQVDVARNHTRHLQWSEPLAIPLSSARVLLVGTNHAEQESRQ